MDSRKRARTWIGAALAAIGAALALAPAAHGFGLDDLVATPSDDRAGANSDLRIGLRVTEPEADLRDLTIHLPPGLVGNPLATPTCSEEQLAANECPQASTVGEISNDVTVQVLGFLPVPLTVSGDVYNVAPRPGEPARFGIVLNPLPFNVPVLGPVVFPEIILQSGARLRQSDFGLDSVLTDLPNSTSVAGLATAIDIRGVTLELLGQVGDPPQGFLRNPTSCGTHTVGFSATAYTGATASGQTSFETVDCEALPFAPGFSATLRPMGRDGQKPEVTTSITQTIEEAGLRRARVTLPPELGADNSALNQVCQQAEFAAGNCPPGAVVGEAVAASPLLAEPLAGPVVLLAPAQPGLPDVGLDLRGPLALKLRGSFLLDASGTGVQFDDLPDIPIADFRLTFRGGDGGLVVASRPICDPPPLRFTTDFLAHSGVTSQGTTEARVEGSCDRAGKRKRPRATVRLSKLGSERPKLTLKVRRGEERIKRVRLKLPKKLSFAAGKRFARGTKARAGGSKLRGKRVKHTRRALVLKPKRPAGKLKATVAKGALEARKLRPNARPRFKVRVTERSGRKTTLNVRAR